MVAGQYLFGMLFGIYLCYNLLAIMPMLVILYFSIYPFSPNTYVRLICFLQGSWLQSLVFFMETVLGLQVRLTGDAPVYEPSLVLSNHLTHDWIAIYCHGCRSGSLGVIRTVIKKSLLLFPGFGAGMWMCQWPFVTRNYNKDVKVLSKLFNLYKGANIPVQLWIFPEGTRMTDKKLEESQSYQKEKGYPVWNNVLLPRHRGFTLALNSLMGVITHVNEMTIWYDGYKRPIPDLIDLVGESPKKKHVLHIHQNRVPIAAVPLDEEGRQKWLMESFARKEVLLEYRKKHGQFPGNAHPNNYTTKNSLPHIIVWGLGSFILSGVWIKLYYFFSGSN
eukprot:GDKK01063540.1.p1 GENE.GDKK01063540.1~~GDKK01063540.1.p1  ORF type:complete len:333 (-),score=9.64 GDKK01063540.1:43-1041(-)